MSTRRALQALRGHLKGTSALKTLKHLGRSGTWALGHLDTKGLGHSDTWAFRPHRHWGTRKLKARGHLGTRGTLFSRLYVTILNLRYPFHKECISRLPKDKIISKETKLAEILTNFLVTFLKSFKFKTK